MYFIPWGLWLFRDTFTWYSQLWFGHHGLFFLHWVFSFVGCIAGVSWISLLRVVSWFCQVWIDLHSWTGVVIQWIYCCYILVGGGFVPLPDWIHEADQRFGRWMEERWHTVNGTGRWVVAIVCRAIILSQHHIIILIYISIIYKFLIKYIIKV